MNDYKIFVDAAADVDVNYIRENIITVLSMQYTNNFKVIDCTGLETDSYMKNFYDNQRNGETTETRPMPQEYYEGIFEPLVRHGVGVLYLCFSSELSPSYNSAVAAKLALEARYGKLPIYILNSRSATGGVGVLAEEAVNNKRNGYLLDANVQRLTGLCGKIRSWFYVNDLDYLRRDGKTTASKSFIGTLLGVKPILEISSDGVLRQISKKLGSKKACELLKDLYMEHKNTSYNPVVYITHSDDAESASRLKSMILSEDPGTVIKIKTLSPIIGAHTGPGVITIHHIGK
ncbi:MAG: DegV family EDD domain-containing protein [Oscillospiraceae bacterium]|nr:DegV family EDD domain-containing protein [Oscillospiraceae bacterium]